MAAIIIVMEMRQEWTHLSHQQCDGLVYQVTHKSGKTSAMVRKKAMMMQTLVGMMKSLLVMVTSDDGNKKFDPACVEVWCQGQPCEIFHLLKPFSSAECSFEEVLGDKIEPFYLALCQIFKIKRFQSEEASYS